MRFPSIILIAAVFALGGGNALAQTSGKISNRVLLRQDSDTCAKQVDRHRMDEFADCMSKRQAEHKAAAKQKADECKKQAADQNLHYVKRLRFIRKCKAAG
jgi:hypothetical protein